MYSSCFLGTGVFCLFLLFLLTAAASQPPPKPLRIWPRLAPGETQRSRGDFTHEVGGRYGAIGKLANISEPELIFYPAAGPKQLQPTVLVCPGGGYYIVTTDIEGREIALWLNGLGCNAAVLHYRVPHADIPTPARRMPALEDAQRAMSLLRAQAQALRIDPHRLGVIGFSAGGHLAARLACGGARAYPAVDAVDTAGFRPDFALLIYPAYLWDTAANRPAPEVAPTAQMPPMFLMQTRDDEFLDADLYAAALQEQGAQTACRICAAGGHGYGLRLPPKLPAHSWAAEAAAWLQRQTGPSHSR